MTREKYLEILEKRGPIKTRLMVNKMGYDELHELWEQLTGETMDLNDVKRGYKGKTKEALKPFYRMDIWRYTQYLLAEQQEDIIENGNKDKE